MRLTIGTTDDVDDDTGDDDDDDDDADGSHGRAAGHVWPRPCRA